MSKKENGSSINEKRKKNTIGRKMGQKDDIISTRSDDTDDAVEDVTIREGLRAISDIASNNPDYMVMSDDEVLENMKNELEKKIFHATDEAQKAELKKELLIMKILILQREKIDKEAAIILNDADAFGKDISELEASKKKKREKERQRKQEELQSLICTLNNLSTPAKETKSSVKPKKANANQTKQQPLKANTREKNGNYKEERIR